MKLRQALFAGAVALSSSIAFAADPLPALHAQADKFSVSGLSSGAAMATQLSVAYSDRISAVGMIAGPPYVCAQGAARTAVVSCLTMPVKFWGFTIPNIFLPPRDHVEANDLIDSARRFSAEGSIPSVENLKQQKIWVARGSLDKIVGPNATHAVRRFYMAFGAGLSPEEMPPVPHTLPTDKQNLGPCDGTHEDPDYVSSCGIDEVGRMFIALFGGQPAERGKPLPANLREFDQAPYIESIAGKKLPPATLSMAATGRVYIPSVCTQKTCPVHVAIHGCKQGSDAAYDLFTREGGYNEWAESKRMIVLYPRVVASQALPVNPEGCWDWWGYTNAGADTWEYAKRDSSQMRAIVNMVQALVQKPASPR